MRSSPSMAFVVCSLLIAVTARGEEFPYTSAGFLEFPDSVRLDAVSAVAVNKNDELFVLHRGAPPVVVFDANRKFVRAFGEGKFKVPHGLRCDADGNVWTTDNGNHVLRKFTPAGELLVTLGTEGKGLGGKEGFRSPDDLVFDSQGNMFVADAGNGRIVKLTAAGEYVSQFGTKGKGPGQFGTAHSMAIDAADRIYVGDRGNKRIQLFSPAGEHLADWTGFGNAFGVLVVSDRVLASEGDANKLFLLDHEGKIVSQWGEGDALKLPHLMAVDARGTIYVCEVNGKRVQMLKKR